MKKRRKGKDSKTSKDKVQTGSSSKGKTQSKYSSTGKTVNADSPVEELVHEAAMDVQDPIMDDVNQAKAIDNGLENTWLQDLVNDEKPPLTFDDLISIPINFSVFAMNRLNIDKLTKVDLVGPVYKLLKGTCKSSIELEYNMDQCYNALMDQLDWTNSKGDRLAYDLSKPLPLQGSPGFLTILVDFFFNNDLEY
ncbi:hypothetical protein Tco_1115619 [Tanacetum coccineum]